MAASWEQLSVDGSPMRVYKAMPTASARRPQSVVRAFMVNAPLCTVGSERVLYGGVVRRFHPGPSRFVLDCAPVFC